MLELEKCYNEKNNIEFEVYELKRKYLFDKIQMESCLNEGKNCEYICTDFSIG